MADACATGDGHVTVSAQDFSNSCSIYAHGMRRRVCDQPVQVEVQDNRPTRFRRDQHGYEVVTFLKLLTLFRPQDDLDIQLWVIRARRDDDPPRTYELRRDHGEWRLSAVWF